MINTQFTGTPRGYLQRQPQTPDKNQISPAAMKTQQKIQAVNRRLHPAEAHALAREAINTIKHEQDLIRVLSRLEHFGLDIRNHGQGLLFSATQQLEEHVFRHGGQVVNWLLDHGANPNEIDPASGRAPIHNIFERFMWVDQMTQALLSHGADPNLPDRNGNTALHLAVIFLGNGDERDRITSYNRIAHHPRIDLFRQNNQHQTPADSAIQAKADHHYGIVRDTAYKYVIHDLTKRM